MSDREHVENEIRRLLATEIRTTVLSNALFQQGTGLFGRLWSTAEEKKAVMESDLFRQALARIRELEYRDVAVLHEASQLLKERFPDANFRLMLESTTRPVASAPECP